MPTYKTIRGTTMSGGYQDDFGPTRMSIAMSGGAAYEYDTEAQAIDRNPPLVIDIDGLVTRRAAAAGYGFLPDDGEIERITRAGIRIPVAA